MASILGRHLESLAGVHLPGYEWKCLMIILASLQRTKTDAVSISLDYFMERARIAKPHVCRALNGLEQKGIIGRITFRGNTAYTFNQSPDSWKTGDGIDAEIREAFEKWFARYPVQMRKQEALEAWALVLGDGEATADQLEDALTGYLNYNAARDKRFRRKPDPMFMMIAGNFLHDQKYVDYIRFKDAVVDAEDDPGGAWAQERKERNDD